MRERETLIGVNRDGGMAQALQHLLQRPVLQNAAIIHFQRLCHDSYTHEYIKGVTDPRQELANQVESGTAVDTITVVIISWLPHIMSLNARVIKAQISSKIRSI